MTPELWLTLMSMGLVLPVMLAVLYLALSGKLGRSEDARYLPTLDPEHDFWQQDDEGSPEEGGQEP